MPKTLLVVDDSATMRKVFEMTFAGEDISVVTHDGSESLLARAREAQPAAAVVDVSLGHTTGYDVCRALKSDAALGRIPVILLYSEHSPLDEARMREAGADGSLAKPFDSQAAIDKVKQALQGGAPATASQPQAWSAGHHRPAVPAPPGSQPSANTQGAPVRPPLPVAAPPAPARPPAAPAFGTVGPSPSGPVGRGTVVFGQAPQQPAVPSPSQQPATRPLPLPSAPMSAPAPQQQPAPRKADSGPMEVVVESGDVDEIVVEGDKPEAPAIKPSVQQSAAQPAAAIKPSVQQPAAQSAPAAVAMATSALSTELSQKVAALGLTPAQVEAVASLTREVVERVVWEVVPQLAETLIREEIRRLTAD